MSGLSAGSISVSDEIDVGSPDTVVPARLVHQQVPSGDAFTIVGPASESPPAIYLRADGVVNIDAGGADGAFIGLSGPVKVNPQADVDTGTPISALDFGQFAVVTDDSGIAQVPHNLGGEPKSVFVQMGNHHTTVAKVLPAGLNASTFAVQFVNSTTGNPVGKGNNMDGSYLAIA